MTNWQMQEELDAEYFAKFDYMREAYGDTADCGEDYYPGDHENDWIPGGVAPATAARVIGEALFSLSETLQKKAWLAGNADPDYIPF